MGVKFDPVSGTLRQRDSGSVAGKTVNPGALLANTPVSIPHDLGLTNYQLQVTDNVNNVEVQTLKKDPADPTNKVIIEVGVAVAGGLDVSIIGYN